MAISLPDLVGKIKIDDSALKQLPNTFSGVGGKLSSVGATMTKGLTLPILAVGAGLVKLGSDFDNAADTIRVGTGATGKELAGLEASFKNVVKDVPTDFGSAGEAISDLNTRTGATGKTLEGLAKQELELARITGTDLKSNIESTTRVFGDWGIASEDQSAALDKLFRASQATGIGVDQLASQVVQFGAPLRQMGFSFEESIGLLGKFEKEGVNSELVMGSLRIALGKLAKSGKEPVQAFKEQVEAIKSAGDAGKANALALELFGARAGPDMAAAIREGRFELGDLFETITNGKETILGTGEATQDFAEKWTKVKNDVFIALEPLSRKMFNAIGTGAEKIAPLIKKAAQAFGDMSPQMQKVLIGGAAFLAAIGPIVFVVGKLIAVFGGLAKAFQAVWLVMRLLQLLFVANPFGLLIAAVVGLGILIYKNWDTIKEATVTAWNFIKDHISEIMRVVLAVLTGGLSEAVMWVVRNWDQIKVKTSEVWDGIKAFMGVALRAILAIITGGLSEAVMWVVRNWDEIKAKTSAIWNSITSALSSTWKDITSAVSNGVNNAGNAISSGWESAKSTTSNAWNAIKGAVSAGIDAVINFVRGVPGRILSALGNLGSTLVGAGRALMDGLLNGIRQAWERVAGYLSGLASKIKSLKGPLEKDRKLLVNEGEAIMQSLLDGLENRERDLTKWLAGITASFPATIGVPAVATAAGFRANTASAPVTNSNVYNVYVTGVFDLTNPNVAYEFGEKAVRAIQQVERGKG